MSSRPHNRKAIVGTQLGSVSGIVAAHPDDVWRALLAVLPELAGLDRTVLGQLTQRRTFTVPIGDPAVGTTTVDVDPQRREVSQKGQWWYQGVVAVAAHTDGSTITRTIINVAPGWRRWLVPFVHRHDAHALQSQHEALLRALGERLGACASANATSLSGN